MRISKVVFLLGLVILAIGILMAIAIPASVTWRPKSKPLCTDEIIEVSEYEKSDYYYPYFVFIIPLGETKDFKVEGSAEEVSDYPFHFYIFNETNYDLFKAERPCIPYFEAKSITQTTYSFPVADKEVATDLYFVVENPEPYGSDRVVKLTAIVKWMEKETIIGIIGGLILGGIIGLIGFIMALVGGIITLVSKPKPSTVSSSSKQMKEIFR